MDNTQSKQRRNKALAVITSDVHYNLNTIKLADASMKQAITKANELNIPLIVAGDLLDQKAILRAEYVNVLINTIQLCNKKPFLIVGNHSRINERAPEHALNFLAPYANIIDKPEPEPRFEAYLIPYHHDPDELRAYIKAIPEGSRLIMHQGIEGSNSGEYIQDKSAISQQDVRNYRTISGHYHARQDISCGPRRKHEVGVFSYIGNPYTLSFGEARDPEKGYRILYEDGTLEFIPTNLRKHIVYETTVKEIAPINVRPEDLLWVKISGSKEELSKLTRKKIALLMGITENFKLDFIPIDNSQIKQPTKLLKDGDLLDHLIDTKDISREQKERLKTLWKGI